MIIYGYLDARIQFTRMGYCLANIGACEALTSRNKRKDNLVEFEVKSH